VCPTTYGSARKLATPSRSLIVRRDGLTVRLFTRYGQLNRIETRRLSLPLPSSPRRVPNLATDQRTIHGAAVVGSIIFLTSVIFVAGKPLISACFRMMASSLAR
jgi:hypothetical protein